MTAQNQHGFCWIQEMPSLSLNGFSSANHIPLEAHIPVFTSHTLMPWQKIRIWCWLSFLRIIKGFGPHSPIPAIKHQLKSPLGTLQLNSRHQSVLLLLSGNEPLGCHRGKVIGPELPWVWVVLDFVQLTFRTFQEIQTHRDRRRKVCVERDVLVQSAFHIHGLCVCGLSQLQMANTQEKQCLYWVCACCLSCIYS